MNRLTVYSMDGFSSVRSSVLVFLKRRSIEISVDTVGRCWFSFRPSLGTSDLLTWVLVDLHLVLKLGLVRLEALVLI